MTVEEARRTLQTDKLAQDLLGSPIVARLAYTWRDGSPRVVPMWFHWTGEDILMGAPPNSPRWCHRRRSGGALMAKQWIPEFAQSGASPPGVKTAGSTTNYTINVVRFRVVREPGESRTRQAPLSTSAAVAALAAQIIPDDAREHFGVLMLDAQNRLVVYHEVSTGTLSASLVHPREVFGPALRVMGVAAIVLVHNHPSGEPAPSREDLRLTRHLVEAGKLLDITVHDHIILGTDDAYVSFAERGLL